MFGWLLHNKHTLGVKKNIIYFSLIVTGALFFSFSRAAWLGFVIWLIVLWWQRLQLRESQVTQLKYAALTFGILTVLFFPMVSTRVAPSATAQTEQRSVAERIAGFSQFKSVMRDHWFAGTGLGAYTTRLFGATGDTRTPVHAAPLLVFAELGLFGVALIVTIAWLSRMRISTRTVLLALIPIALFDHYLFSLWSGQVVLFLMLFQMFQIRDNDKADDNQQ
ncbi:MAG: hypothetical protein A2848_01690 [Candidatus Magasanikbacteria bacterium RIFCSPHIGHO2_01_FULL_50_8]|uniref:O-antigen ligase-related domain-containing protein n=1 Tax=Candidatus Magasanikbacteria bacterium RIFCSPHIGHO2_01_FULL_50_8 TaxID=1798674 RepID=A0A1F6LVI9_9BACT|nr:MAG: hypothetical protein A2848_01690 [Candidatus Magasanikbacteria bacterium RIFCSPHIGHO2_01_FULL_50_8]